LFDRLAEHFGADRVFRDADMIRPGDDFAERIQIALASCSVLLALIGEGWLTAADASGRRRLNLPGDYVRLEIETALARGILIIPVLVDGARMPRAADLPSAISALAGRQALTLSPGRFTSDVSYLLSALDTALASANSRPRPGPSGPGRGRSIGALVAAGVACCAILGTGGYWLTRDPSGSRPTPPPAAGRTPTPTPTPTPTRTATPTPTRTATGVPRKLVKATSGAHPSQSAGATSPPASPAGERLDINAAPSPIMNSGQDVRVVVTVNGAPPDGVITWEQSVINIRGPASIPPCYYHPTSEYQCGVDLKHGTATANGDGVATFYVTFVPGQVYDAANVQNASDFDAVVLWNIDVWDDSSETPAVVSPTLETTAGAPPPSDWSRS
jgi:TIR domain